MIFNKEKEALILENEFFDLFATYALLQKENAKRRKNI
jgi:hypothetical protein